MEILRFCYGYRVIRSCGGLFVVFFVTVDDSMAVFGVGFGGVYSVGCRLIKSVFYVIVFIWGEFYAGG